MILQKEMTERAQEEIMWIYTGPDLEEEAGQIQDFFKCKYFKELGFNTISI